MQNLDRENMVAGSQPTLTLDRGVTVQHKKDGLFVGQMTPKVTSYNQHTVCY